MVDLENKSQEFQDLYALANPLPGARAKVPLLEIASEQEQEEPLLLCESLVVSDYIAEEFGGGDDNTLLPASAKDRATMRLFTELCGSSFSYFPILRAKGDKLESERKTLTENLVAADAFLKHYKSGPFLFGDKFSLAECSTAPFVQRLCTILPVMTGGAHGDPVDPMKICDELGLDHLKAWMEAVLKRPSVIATGVPKDTLLERTAAMLKRLEAMAVDKPMT